MKTLKYVLYITASAVILCTLLYVTGRLVQPKYATGVREGAMTEDYYQEKNPHDVILLGDCEVYENFSPVTMWQERGITSYVRGNSQQLIWQSYYLLEETFRIESPKVVVFNVHSMRFSEPQNEAYNRMMLDGMRWSSSKVNAVRASMLEEENFLSYVFPLFRYHDRWSALNRDDLTYWFSHEPSTVAGYLIRMDVKPMSRLPQPPILEDPDFDYICFDYLDKIRLLCQENGAELVLIKSSSVWPKWYDEWEEQIVSYAEQNNLTYINFIDLQDEIGIDFETDTYDGGLHLNLYGAEKASAYLAEYLQAHFDLEDHRSDPELCNDWNDKILRYEAIQQEQLYELETYGYLKSWMPDDQE